MAVAEGVAITVFPVVIFKSLDAAQLCVSAPEAVSGIMPPSQSVVLPETETTGR
ncbi:MAG: hypothetical protein IPL22_18510 [Bacteroidetes bacterium]|nr:hypothetical protein [Bacteroidota bacterium]